MLIKSERIQKEGEENYYIEAIFDSSNVLKTLYFPHRKRLYISFKRGGTYSYGNITQELYDRFEKADSQGMFHEYYIRDRDNQYPYRKEFTLYPSEVKDVDHIIEEKKKESQELTKENINEDDDDIVNEVLRIYHQTYGYTFDNLVHTDPKFLSLLKAFKEGYVLGNEEKTSIADDEPLNENYPPNNDELYATIEILHQALHFYANKVNYLSKDSLFSPIQIDNGFQAEYAIKLVNKLEEERYKELEKLQEEYGGVNFSKAIPPIVDFKTNFKGLLE